MALYDLGFAKPDDDESKDALDQLKALMTKPTGDLPVMKFSPMDIVARPPVPKLPAPPQPDTTPAPAVQPPPDPSFGQSSGPLGVASQMFTGSLPQGYDMAGLEQAQNQAKTERIKALLFRAADTMGSAFSHVPVDENDYKARIDQANQPLQFEQQKNQRIQELLQRANQARTAQLAQTKEDREAANAKSLEEHRLRLEELAQQRANAPYVTIERDGTGQAYLVDHRAGQQPVPIGGVRPPSAGRAGAAKTKAPAYFGEDIAPIHPEAPPELKDKELEETRNSVAANQELIKKLGEYQQILSRSSAAGRVVGPDAQRLKTLHGEMTPLWLEAKGQKRMTDADIHLFQSILPVVTGQGVFTMPETASAGIQQIANDAKGGIDTRLHARGLMLKGGGQADAPTVTVRRKADGKTKTLPAAAAAKYLNDPAFERVQ